MKMLFVILFVLLFNHVSAETYLQINGTSLHDKPGYNQFNYGGGIEQTVNDDWSVAGGWYRNSEYRSSTYSYGRYSFYRNSDWNLGVGVGLVTGYKRMSVMPMAFPEACYSYLCALFLPKVDPSGANVIGFHFKIPVN
jgi:hypothetical protein